MFSGDPKLMSFAKKISDNFGSGLDLKNHYPEVRETEDDAERSVTETVTLPGVPGLPYPGVFPKRVGSDKSTGTPKPPKPLRFNVDTQTDSEKGDEQEEKGVEKQEQMSSKTALVHSSDRHSPKITQGPLPVADNKDDDQCSTDTYDSVWDIPHTAQSSPWRPAMNSTELLPIASETPTKGESTSDLRLALKKGSAPMTRRVELSIEEIFWEREVEESSNADTHRGSNDGLQDDL